MEISDDKESSDLDLALAVLVDEEENRHQNDPSFDIQGSHQVVLKQEGYEMEENENADNSIDLTATIDTVVDNDEDIDEGLPGEVPVDNIVIDDSEIFWTVPPPDSILPPDTSLDSNNEQREIGTIDGDKGMEVEQNLPINVYSLDADKLQLKVNVHNLHCYLCSKNFPNAQSFATHHHQGSGGGGDNFNVKIEKTCSLNNDDDDEIVVISTKFKPTTTVQKKSTQYPRLSRKRTKTRKYGPCKICGLCFIRKGDETRHQSVHLPKVPQSQSKQISSRPVLGDSLTTNCLQNKDQVDVTCNKCYTSFLSLKEFNDHLHHKSTPIKSLNVNTPPPSSSIYNNKSLSQSIDQDENSPPSFDLFQDDDFDFELPQQPVAKSNKSPEKKIKYSTRRQQLEEQATVENDEDEKNRFCIVCQKSFRSVKLFETHRRINHTRLDFELALQEQELHPQGGGWKLESKNEWKTDEDKSLKRVSFAAQQNPSNNNNNCNWDFEYQPASFIPQSPSEITKATTTATTETNQPEIKKKRVHKKPFRILYEMYDEDFSPTENSDGQLSSNDDDDDSSCGSGPAKKKKRSSKANSGRFKKKPKPPEERIPKESRFTCELCGKSFKEHNSLKRHHKLNAQAADYADKTHRDPNNPNWYKERFKCPYMCDCDPFEFKCQMKMHALVHRIPGDKPHKCIQCPKSFAKINHLKLHYMSHSQEKPFLCSICGSSMVSRSSYNVHMAKHEYKERGYLPFKCSTCGKQFSTKGYLQRHVLVHLPEKPFKCTFEGCSRSFRTSVELKIHINVHTGENVYKCSEPECGKEFRLKLSLQNHMKLHRPASDDKILQCLKCGKEFTSEIALKGHLKRHEDSESNITHTCSECSKSYKNLSNLKQHMMAVHQNIRKFLCQDCGKSFFHSSGYRKHVRTHTGEKPFKCTYEGCQQAFNSSSSLKDHVRRHENQRGYKCTFEGCTKGFNARSTLRRHILTHTGKRPHKCPYCTASYPEIRNLHRHLASIHQEQPQQHRKQQKQQQQYQHVQENQQEVTSVVVVDPSIYTPDTNTMIDAPEPEIEYQVYDEEGEDQEEEEYQEEEDQEVEYEEESSD